MIENSEQQNLMKVYPCQLKDLKLSCYGCCRNGVSTSNSINKDVLKNNFDFKKIYINSNKSEENLKTFRDRYNIKETLSSGVCRNLVDFEDNCKACPLHPLINSVVNKSETIAPKEDLRVGFCDTNFECDTVKFWNNMNLVERNEFVKFLKNKDFDNHTYSMTNINGELIQEFFRRRNEFVEFDD